MWDTYLFGRFLLFQCEENMLCFFITYKYKLILEILGVWRKIILIIKKKYCSTTKFKNYEILSLKIIQLTIFTNPHVNVEWSTWCRWSCFRFLMVLGEIADPLQMVKRPWYCHRFLNLWLLLDFLRQPKERLPSLDAWPIVVLIRGLVGDLNGYWDAGSYYTWNQTKLDRACQK